jgi:hypothetical protein
MHREFSKIIEYLLERSFCAISIGPCLKTEVGFVGIGMRTIDGEGFS